MKLKTIYCLVLFSFLAPLLAIGDKSPTFTNDPCAQGGKKSPPPPQCGCAPIVDKDVKIFLNFNASNDPSRICGVDVDGASDPARVTGTTDPSNGSTYYCVVTVAPNIPNNCLIGTNYTFKLTTPFGNGERALMIRIPQGVVSAYKVDFYEKCNFCHNNQRGRPYYTFSGTIGTNETFTFANLLYQYTNPC
jgi:hypothetical protein